MKEKNKSLLINSLISVSMCIMPFSAMADGNMEQGSKLEATIKTINAEQNVKFPKTNNEIALYPSDKDGQYRVTPQTESFVFMDAEGNAMNTDDTVKTATYNNAVGYKLTGTESVNTVTGFVSGRKEVEDSGNGKYKGQFFRYWNPSTTSEDDEGNKYNNDGQFSPSFPKLCHTGNPKNGNSYPTTNKMRASDGKPDNPLIRLASVGGDSNSTKESQMRYESTEEFYVPIVNMNSKELTADSKLDFEGITFVDSGDSILICNTKKDGCTLTWDAENNCMRINKYGSPRLVDPDTLNNTYIYDNPDGRLKSLVNCEDSSLTDSCSASYVKSFRRNNAGEAYRISQLVRLDIEGNKEPIEVPQQTCFRCLKVQTEGIEDTSCSYIVDEVFEAKGGDCAATVAALAVDPRAVKEYLPKDMNSEYNCRTCLCKIEELLKAKGCN